MRLSMVGLKLPNGLRLSWQRCFPLLGVLFLPLGQVLPKLSFFGFGSLLAGRYLLASSIALWPLVSPLA